MTLLWEMGGGKHSPAHHVLIDLHGGDEKMPTIVGCLYKHMDLSRDCERYVFDRRVNKERPLPPSHRAKTVAAYHVREKGYHVLPIGTTLEEAMDAAETMVRLRGGSGV